jgi:hypothetical protein
VTSTGFTVAQGGGPFTYIYMAIRRGPMAVPTDATKVFSPNQETTSTNPQTLTTGFPVDLSISTLKDTAINRWFLDRLRGSTTTAGKNIFSNSDGAEQTSSGFGVGLDNNTGVVDNAIWNAPGTIFWNFRRAPSFFDEVCYTGTGVARTVAHNLAAVPELMIVKRRNDVREWNVYASPLGATKFMFLNTPDAVQTDTMWNDTAPTSSVFTVGTYQGVNASASTYVAYLFATCAGVSKVGSYTGNGTTQTINCGFTGGARFVIIKRTDAAGGWYVYDTARGMTVLTDPYLFLNNTDVEAATLGSVTTVSTGFALNSTILAAINISGGTYIFLAIA